MPSREERTVLPKVRSRPILTERFSQLGWYPGIVLSASNIAKEHNAYLYVTNKLERSLHGFPNQFHGHRRVCALHLNPGLRVDSVLADVSGHV